MSARYIGPHKPDEIGDELGFHCRCGVLHTVILDKTHFAGAIPRWILKCGRCKSTFEIILNTSAVNPHVKEIK